MKINVKPIVPVEDMALVQVQGGKSSLEYREREEITVHL